MLPPIVLELRAKASELYSELGKVKGEVRVMAEETEHSSGRMQSAFHAAAGAGKAVALVGIGAAIAVGGFSLEAAATAQVVDAKLNTSLKNAGSSFEKLSPQIEEADAKNRKFGVSNEDTNTGLATLTTALGDPKKALADIGIVTDLARLKNISFSAAAVLVAKTSEGQSRGLKALGIDLPIAATNAASLAKANDKLKAAQENVNAITAQTPVGLKAVAAHHAALAKAQLAVASAQHAVTVAGSAGDQMLEALRKRVQGAASAYGDTFAGKLASARAEVTNIAEKIGKALMPIVESAIAQVVKWGKFLDTHRGVLLAIAIVVGTVLVAAIGAYIASLIVAAVTSVREFGKMAGAARTWAVENIGSIVKTSAAWIAANAKNIAVTAVQIGSLIAQKAALVGSAVVMGVVTAAQWLWNVAMDANPIGAIIMGVVLLVAAIVWLAFHWKEAYKWLQTYWPLIIGFMFGPLALVIALIVQHWGEIVGFFKKVGEVILKWWIGLWDTVAGWLHKTFGPLIDWVVGYFRFSVALFRAVGTVLLSWWNGLWNGIVSFVRNTFGPIIDWAVDYFKNVVAGFQIVGAALTGWWNGLWSGIAGWLVSTFSPVIAWVVTAFRNSFALLQTVGDAIATWWNGLWSGIAGFVSTAFGAIVGVVKGVFNTIIGIVNTIIDSINKVISTANTLGGGIGIHITAIPHLGSFASGLDRVPGSDGTPYSATVHGGESILSNDMLSGSRAMPRRVLDAAANQLPGSGAGGSSTVTKSVSMTNNFNTNANPGTIQASLGWLLQRQG